MLFLGDLIEVGNKINETISAEHPTSKQNREIVELAKISLYIATLCTVEANPVTDSVVLDMTQITSLL